MKMNKTNIYTHKQKTNEINTVDKSSFELIHGMEFIRCTFIYSVAIFPILFSGRPLLSSTKSAKGNDRDRESNKTKTQPNYYLATMFFSLSRWLYVALSQPCKLHQCSASF